MATKALRRPGGTAILQVRVELRGMKPKVWRRVLVPQTITLLKLHLVIQAAFGWGHSHLHEFIAGDGERYGTADPMDDAPDSINSDASSSTPAGPLVQIVACVNNTDFGCSGGRATPNGPRG